MDALECKPLITDETLVLKPWVPIGKSLATFRDYVAGTSDFRISNFQVGLRIEHAKGSCTWLIAGQNPPDGSLWSACAILNDAAKCEAKQDVEPQTTFLWNQLSLANETKQCLQK
jgi:hypothetical protein